MNIVKINSCFINIYTNLFIIISLVFISFDTNSQNFKIGLPPNKSLSELHLTHWNTENGLPSNSVNDVFQSKDGFIWIATFESFIKFDGIELSPLKDNNGLTESRLIGGNSIYQDSKGNIWLSTVGLGAAVYEESNFKLIEGMSNMTVSSVYEDSRKNLWIGSVNFGVFNWDGENLTKTNYSEITDVSIPKIAEDPNGSIWFATEGKGITYLQNEEHRTFTTSTGLYNNSVICIFPDEDGSVWIGTSGGLNQYKNGRILKIEYTKDINIRDIIKDDYGNLWIATTNGLYRRNALTNNFEQFSVKDGLPDRDLNNLTFDKEGNLWIGSTRNGMFQLRQTSFHKLGQKEGLKIGKMNIVSEVKKGEYILGDDNGKIYNYKNGTFKNIPIRNKNIKNQRIRDIYEDSKGNIWICTYAGLLKIKGKSEKLYTIADGMSSNQTRVVFEDLNGRIWVGTRNGGLTVFEDENVTNILNKKDGLSSDFVMSLDIDKQGNLLVGTVGGGLNIIDQSGNIKSYVEEENGKLKDVIFNCHVDEKNAVWICTNHGITRFFEGEFKSISKKEGLKMDRAFDFLEDEYGNVWVSSSKGVARINKKEINDFMDGKIPNINSEIFDKYEGMPSTQCIAPTESLKSQDGRLWFPTEKGVAIIDPSNIIKNKIVPPVHINEMKVDNKLVSKKGFIDLPPETKRVEFDFSALSYITPSKVNFKYKLEGFDQEWLKPEHNERYVIYTNLSQGRYTFKVIGSNNHGIWNETGASQTFYIKPYFYQTRVFYLFTIITISFGIWGGIKWRTRVIKKQSIILQKIVDQRTIEIREQQEEIIQQRDNLEISYKSVKRLSDIGKKITSCLSVDAILNTSFENLNQLMKAPNFAIGIFDDMTQTINFFGKEENVDSVLTGKDSLKEDTLFSVWCFKNQREVFINDLKKEIYNYPPVTFHHKSAINSLMYLPLKTKDKDIGVITVQDVHVNSYSDYDLNIFRNLAISVSIALENAYVYEQIKIQKREIENQSQKLKDAHLVIQNKNDELSNTNQLLEDKVFKRTHELRKAMKELDLYIYRSAHDLNGPVARIAGLCNLLRKEEDPLLKNQYIDMMYQNSTDMKKLLDKLMRIQVSKNKPLKIEKIDIENELNRIYNSFSWHRNFNKVHFNVILKGNVNFHSDLSLVIHLFENLIDNSLNYMDPDKNENYINIEIYQGGDKECRFTIKDNGLGVSKDVAGKIFTMFFRGSELSKGFGLGLFESKMIIKKLNGKLWFKKSNKFETEFLAFLPSGNKQQEKAVDVKIVT